MTCVSTVAGIENKVGEEVVPAKLRKAQPADSSVRVFRVPRGLQLAQLGLSFWHSVWGGEAGGSPMSAASKLKDLTYTDRYLASPLAARALHALLAGLRQYGLQPSTSIVIKTAEPLEGRDHDALHSNFYGRAAQKAVLEGLMRHLSPTATVEIAARSKDLPHARLLELHWDDGTRMRCGLDQGVGFVETKRRERFTAQAPHAEQIRELLSCNVELVGDKETWVWTQRLTGQKK